MKVLHGKSPIVFQKNSFCIRYEDESKMQTGSGCMQDTHQQYSATYLSQARMTQAQKDSSQGFQIISLKLNNELFKEPGAID